MMITAVPCSPPRPLLEGAVRHARDRHERHEEERVEDVFAIAELVVDAERVQRERDRDRARQHGDDDALDVGQARVAPDALVEAEEEVDRDLDRHRDHEGLQQLARLGVGYAVHIQEHGRREECEAKRDAVVQRCRERPGIRFD